MRPYAACSSSRVRYTGFRFGFRATTGLLSDILCVCSGAAAARTSDSFLGSAGGNGRGEEGLTGAGGLLGSTTESDGTGGGRPDGGGGVFGFSGKPFSLGVARGDMRRGGETRRGEGDLGA